VSEKQLQAVKNKKRKNKKARDDKRQEQLAHVWKNNWLFATSRKWEAARAGKQTQEEVRVAVQKGKN